MQQIRFKDWVFDIDVEKTRQTYDMAKGGGSDGCVCDYCENYRAQRDRIFPKELTDFFNEIGIDCSKESETYVTHRIENGFLNYGGWFHFAGRILRGEDAHVRTASGYKLKLTPLEDNFQIGFLPDEKSLTFFDKNEFLVQVEFSANLPWVIDKPEPGD